MRAKRRRRPRRRNADVEDLVHNGVVTQGFHAQRCRATCGVRRGTRDVRAKRCRRPRRRNADVEDLVHNGRVFFKNCVFYVVHNCVFYCY